MTGYPCCCTTVAPYQLYLYDTNDPPGAGIQIFAWDDDTDYSADFSCAIGSDFALGVGPNGDIWQFGTGAVDVAEHSTESIDRSETFDAGDTQPGADLWLGGQMGISESGALWYGHGESVMYCTDDGATLAMVLEATGQTHHYRLGADSGTADQWLTVTYPLEAHWVSRYHAPRMGFIEFISGGNQLVLWADEIAVTDLGGGTYRVRIPTTVKTWDITASATFTGTWLAYDYDATATTDYWIMSAIGTGGEVLVSHSLPWGAADSEYASGTRYVPLMLIDPRDDCLACYQDALGSYLMRFESQDGAQSWWYYILGNSRPTVARPLPFDAEQSDLYVYVYGIDTDDVVSTETLALDAVISDTGFSATPDPLDLDEDPDSGDANWATWDGSTNTSTLRVSFPTPSGPPSTGADRQVFRVLLRKNASGGGTPDFDAELRETSGGASLETLATTQTVTDTSGVVYELAWDATNLGTADGSAVELLLTLNSDGGGPNERGIDVGAIAWDVAVEAYSGSNTNYWRAAKSSGVIEGGPDNGTGAPLTAEGSLEVASPIQLAGY